MLKNRQALAEHFAELGFTVGAEIGVCHGEYAKVLLAAMPTLRLFGIDSYRRKPSDRTIADARLAVWITEGRFMLRQMSSVRAAHLFENGSLDFVFIDANHAEVAVREDLETWTPKVRSGGIVSGHDYFRHSTLGIVDAVDRFVAERGYVLQTTDWDRANPDKDCRQPCWWFVKP